MLAVPFPNKDTQLCISIASRPSNFGNTLHNACYRALGLNFIYKSFSATNCADILQAVRALGIRGCSVSMPFKQDVIPHLDELHENASRIGAVNTIVNDNGKLTGYNTDSDGAKAALAHIKAHKEESILLLGAGGVAKAIAVALKDLNILNLQVANRTRGKAASLVDSIGFGSVVDWDKRESTDPDILINATSIGMHPDADTSPLSVQFLSKLESVIDVVVSPPESQLIKLAQSAGLPTAPGHILSLHQAASQFELYTNHPAPINTMQEALNKLLGNA